MNRVNFSKWQGLGNDFILCRAEDVQSANDIGAVARRWCDRHFGIGADGLILLGPGDGGETQLTMTIYNADGSEAAMCGNGIRCLAAWAVKEGWIQSDSFAVGMRSGVKHVTVKQEAEDSWQVEADMGEPQILSPAQPITVGKKKASEYIVSMGNLHRVVLGGTPGDLGADWLNKLAVGAEGRRLEQSACGECNVEFAVLLSAQDIKMRVCERGVGETMACGTGACAVLTAASLEGWCPRRATIHLPGGELAVRWPEDNHVYMRGPALAVFAGNINL
ncbi:MAG: diaminopimelate epimerase [bacterium]|nr:diaminopimelate epimerase [bacterium]